MAGVTRSAGRPLDAVAQDVAAGSRKWVARLARVGFLAKAVLYLTVGLLALKAALGQGGRAADSHGAMRTVLSGPLGSVALAVITLGLFGYALWRLVQAVADPERAGRGAKGLALRVSYAARGLLHGALGFEALRLLLGQRGAGGEPARHWTAEVMSSPLGVWGVALAGLAVLGYGLAQVYRAFADRLRRKLDFSALSRAAAAWALRIARIGTAARGVVFFVVGLFLLKAANEHDPSEATGLGGALRALGQQPYGPWLLALVALGLAAYGVDQFVQARFRRIRT